MVASSFEQTLISMVVVEWGHGEDVASVPVETFKRTWKVMQAVGVP